VIALLRPARAISLMLTDRLFAGLAIALTAKVVQPSSHLCGFVW
jgi:hypothetical protein